eukprot:6284932-Pyramimonas_sp.AAC.1
MERLQRPSDTIERLLHPLREAPGMAQPIALSGWAKARGQASRGRAQWGACFLALALSKKRAVCKSPTAAVVCSTLGSTA